MQVTGGLFILSPFHIVPLEDFRERLVLHSFSSGPLSQIGPYDKLLKKIQKTVSEKIEYFFSLYLSLALYSPLFSMTNVVTALSQRCPRQVNVWERLSFLNCSQNRLKNRIIELFEEQYRIIIVAFLYRNRFPFTKYLPTWYSALVFSFSQKKKECYPSSAFALVCSLQLPQRCLALLTTCIQVDISIN